MKKPNELAEFVQSLQSEGDAVQSAPDPDTTEKKKHTQAYIPPDELVDADPDEESTPKKRKFTLDRRASAFSLKFYAEQLPAKFRPAEDATAKEQASALRAYLAWLLERDHDFYIHGIVHDRDKNKDDLWAPSDEKPHCHILIVMYRVDKYNKIKKIRLGSLLNKLKLKYREGTDDNMLIRGTFFLDQRRYEHINLMVYNTHETYAAKEADGKQQYGRSEVFTNIPEKILNQWYEFYFAALDSPSKGDIKMPNRELKVQYMKIARSIGAAGKDFNEWFFGLPEQIRLVSGLKKVCIDEYNQGVIDFVSSSASTMNVRCCIFIEGAPNVGKTYNAKRAMESLNCKTLTVESGGTGKLDSLLPSHDAIVISDTAVKDILAMSDNLFCFVYRRNNSNPLWCGRYLIITYNGSLRQYIQHFYSQTIKSEEQLQAVLSRFYQLRLTTDGIRDVKPATRGTVADLKSHNVLFKRFIDAFNESFATYDRADSVTPEQLLKQLMPDLDVYEPAKPADPTPGVYVPTEPPVQGALYPDKSHRY